MGGADDGGMRRRGEEARQQIQGVVACSRAVRGSAEGTVVTSSSPHHWWHNSIFGGGEARSWVTSGPLVSYYSSRCARP
jgi:hypothetical protein